MRLQRVVSGGQTGVDRAALEAALECGIPIGGWCPKRRRAEDGVIPGRYPLSETPSRGYRQRTAWNVRDSDATLVLFLGELTGGSRYTAEFAAKQGKPCLAADLDLYATFTAVVEFVEDNRVRVLNVAGPRESGRPGIYVRAQQLLVRAFKWESPVYVLRAP